MPTASLFISGVQKALQEERRAVRAFVEGDPLLRRYFTAFLFEDLSARDRRAADREGGGGVVYWRPLWAPAGRGQCHRLK
jgi:hypothetical protein